ncbi:MAG: DUF3341 domain-containing protein [Bacteroidetes bacterium]|nr:DUF3341 domain-containing protein [Bacteroidota bacterium]
MLKIKRTNCIVAVFNDDHVLLGALRTAVAKGYNIIDVFTPFPVHGIEKTLGIKRSNLGIAAFVFGCIGLCFGLSLTYYTMTYDWRINIGGKPNWPLLSFVPVLFECTILITALGMVTTFYTICKLAPGVIPVIYDKRATDDRFVVLLEDDARGAEIRMIMKENGAEEIRDDVHVTDNFPGPSPLKLR